jgi:pimeloyl-ACP methyl ester carboxylesterase
VLFGLVHGSTQNSSGWDLLITELQRLGHESICVDLPNNPAASATVYAQVIAEKIPRHRNDVTVVAHSASGLFLPLVPAQRLVFLAALIPQPGISLLDQLKASPQMLSPEWLGKNPVGDNQIAHRFLFHDCAPETAAGALTTLRLTNARQAMIEICPLKAWPAIPSTYILCTGDRTIQPEWSRHAARERLGCEALELPGGHCRTSRGRVSWGNAREARLIDHRDELRIDDALIGSKQAQPMDPGRSDNRAIARIPKRV